MKIANRKLQIERRAKGFVWSALIVLPFVGGCQATHSAGDFGGRLWDTMTGKTPLKYAKMMEDPDFPDERRVGINGLVKRDFGKKDPYIQRYQQIAELDTDYTVRAIAIRALNRSRDKSATQTFIKALSDPNDLVRMEACKALNRVPDEGAVEPLIRTLRNANENKDVRIAAAEALRHYKRLDVARALVGQLGERDFSVAWQSHLSLSELTGKDLHYDESAWLGYLTGPEKPFG